jgi:hypothetical protein
METRGDLAAEVRDNIVLWLGMSEDFFAVVRALQGHVTMDPTEWWAVIYSEWPQMPIAKRDYPYKEPHWLPVTFSAKEES